MNSFTAAGGEVSAVDARPDATVGEFKHDVIQTFFDDELSRKVASVELVFAEQPLLDETVTLADSGISEDVVVLAVFGRRTAECLCAEDAPFDLCDLDSFVLLNIPDGTREIPNNAFCDCWSVAGVAIPDSVTKIGHRAFVHCSSLISLTSPDSVIEIGASSVSGCSSLTP